MPFRFATAAPLLPAAIALLGLAACESAPKSDESAAPTADAADVRERYNQRATRIIQFWSRAVVEIDFKDDEGKSRFEQGDGPFIVRKPFEMALAIGKLGKTMYWLGSDVQRFWFFDLNPPKDRPRTAFVGRHEDIGKPGMRPLPIPIRPDDLIQLLGIMPLTASVGEAAIAPEPDAIDGRAGYWFRTPLGTETRGGERQVFIDAATGHALTIRFVDADGVPVAESKLSEYQPLKQVGQPMGQWPDLATRVEVAVPARSARLTLYLSDMTDDKNKVLDAQFDLEPLVKALKVERTETLAPK